MVEQLHQAVISDINGWLSHYRMHGCAVPAETLDKVYRSFFKKTLKMTPWFWQHLLLNLLRHCISRQCITNIFITAYQNLWLDLGMTLKVPFAQLCSTCVMSTKSTSI